jgi:tripartite-type tricarboxylate transporter receptor subunit TctC
MVVDLAIGIPMIESGRVRVFGVTAPQRVANLPQIPTIAEAGLPGYAARGWFSVVARAGTPRPIVERINRILTAYLKRRDVDERLTNLAIDPLTSTPDELAAFIPAEIVKWAKVIKDAGIEPE